MLRIRKDRFRLCRFHNFPLMKNRDPIAEGGERQQIVGDAQNGDAEVAVHLLEKL